MSLSLSMESKSLLFSIRLYALCEIFKTLAVYSYENPFNSRNFLILADIVII
jgi:hypothetical protein